MPFPDSARLIYRRNPLSEVICQVRFPPILRIEAEPPAPFQERVRAGYPLFRELQPDLPSGNVPPEIAGIVKAMLPNRARATAYEFASEDGAWSITLSRDALALKTAAYRRWEEFREHLEGLLAGLTELYRPAFFSRVGLRYVDVIQRSKLGLANQPWSELLKSPIAGEFAAPELAGQIEHAARELRVKLAGEGSVMIRHGIAVEESSDEQCFIIDSDFFVERRLEPQHALGLFNDFNRKSGRLFRWCIQDALHRAMEPTGMAD
jgi:uncharacterized protein (TIGR04255 family)